MMLARGNLAHRGWYRGIDQLQNEIRRIFDEIPQVSEFPAVNVWNDAEKIVLEAEVPGVTAEQLEITVAGDIVTISGERTLSGDEAATVYHRRERANGRFSKTIQLPFSVESNNEQASLTDGVLTLTLPRNEADKPRKISVKSA